jgi:hypothetical protein
MTDETPPEPEDAAPITPEVVDGGSGDLAPPRRGAAGRKRRTGAAAASVPVPDDGTPAPPASGRGRASGRWFRTGCMVLVAVGVLELFVGATRVSNPEKARCDAAQFDIDRANDDDKDFNDVDLPEGVDKADDLDCDQAIELASNIPDKADEPADGTFPGASTFRTQGIFLAVLGLLHGFSGFFTLRTRKRSIRNVALATAALGILLPILQIVSLVAMVFVAWALAFSSDAKALFPTDKTRPSLFRPRPPRGS